MIIIKRFVRTVMNEMAWYPAARHWLLLGRENHIAACTRRSKKSYLIYSIIEFMRKFSILIMYILYKRFRAKIRKASRFGFFPFYHANRDTIVKNQTEHSYL
jgi:hypothetical protein